MDQFKLTVPTYYGAANAKHNVLGHPPDFDAPNVPVLIHQAEGVRVVLGTHDFNDLGKPDVQIERRAKGWAMFLHPVGGCDASGYVYFFDDGRSFLVKGNTLGGSGSIEVLRGHDEPLKIDEMNPPEPDIIRDGPTLGAAYVQTNPENHSTTIINRKTCARCGQDTESCGDWYGDLCPKCADETDCDWLCCRCGRQGSFEEMGGEGAMNPDCCGVPCHRVDPDESGE